jgi:hypothetical protein
MGHCKSAFQLRGLSLSSDTDDRVNSLSGMELARMPNMYGPEETVGNEFAIYDTDIVFDSQCETSRWLEQLVTMPEEPSLASGPSLLPTQESQEIR